MQFVDSRRRFLQAASAGGLAGVAGLAGCSTRERVAVLTFDDAVQSHADFVAPLLKEMGFGATFFITHRWMDDQETFLDWEDAAHIHEMGFEIGNHSWTHAGFSSPKNAARMEGELALVENELAKVGIPKPVSFAWCGNAFGPEALAKLRELSYRFGRRGLSPEHDDHSLAIGSAYDPALHDPLLIPTTGNALPGWSLEFFQRVLDKAGEGVVVLQFHGVPDIAHNWVHTPPENFRHYMQELQRQGFSVLALRDLAELVPAEPVDDPHVSMRNPEPKDSAQLELPIELVQTRADLDAWTASMLRHRYTPEEASAVAGFSAEERVRYEQALAASPEPPAEIQIWPYPGGRHPRISFLEGAINPLRGTKASVFPAWDPESYIVVDLPELITSNLGHLFLAHTHVPTIWKERNVWLDNVDWQRRPDGSLELAWELPNSVRFGSSVQPDGDGVALGLWLHNGLDQTLTGLRTQLCLMLKGARGFNALTLDNKSFSPPVAAVQSADGNRWILTAWERTGRCWGNDRCPCMHADPVFPDCPPGETVRLRGRLWFHEGPSIEAEIEKAKRLFPALPDARA